MAGQVEMLEICQKEDDTSIMNSNVVTSEKIIYGEDENGDKSQSNTCNVLKRYSRYDLLSLRNGQLSIHYPNCALRQDLQALSIWTCRLRCELQYLGLWKIPNTGNLYGNCSCNGSCQAYACNDVQAYSSSNSQANTGNSQVCYGNVQQNQQLQPMQTSSSPTLGSKRAVRSRERSLNYQRCMNTELIRAISPGGNGEGSAQHQVNNQVKSAFIDHRSISSSHLMPAFAKRRMGNPNAIHGQSEVNSNFNNNTEHLSNDDGASENSINFDTSKSRKNSVKSVNQNDYHVYKSSTNNRLEKGDQMSDNNAGWMNLVKKINDYSVTNNKANTASANKKLIYERRIGSGRLVPREGNWDIRTGNKQIEKENITHSSNSNTNNNGEKDNGEIDKLNNRNSSIARYSEPRGQERRIFDRRISNSDDSNNGANNNSNKRYNTTANLNEERNNFESNYHQQSQHFTGQRSMSFRRREYVDHKEHHRDFRDFREPKDSRDSREHREHRGGDQHHHNHHKDHKEEPEWFSEGPTSQHDTIELRGFEEADESQQQQEQIYAGQNSKIERKPSESSLLSHNSCSNINLSTKENFDNSNEVTNNSNNATSLSDKDNDNGSSCNIAKDITTANIEPNDINISAKTEAAQHIVTKSEELKNADKQRSNVTELFFDNFLNIEALENSLIGNVNDQTMASNSEGGSGTSRFSRWFFNNSNNQNTNEEFITNPPIKDDSKQRNKDLNESDFNSFMTFLKCNNIPTPELPKGLPSNVSALSVEELEARMRKMDTCEIEKNKCGNDSDKNLDNNYGVQNKNSECGNDTDASAQPAEINTQDVEAFRKLLDQLGKPRVDISMNIILPNSSGQPNILNNPVGVYPSGMSPIPSNSLPPQSNVAKQEFMMKMMHQQQLMQQQNMGKIVPPHLHPHQRIPQMSPQQQNENMPLMSHHPHMPLIIGHPQKRLDVQHLVQSVLREELSRNFLERELKNPNIPPYAKDIISTVLKETSRFNPPTTSVPNTPESLESTGPNDISSAPNNLMQSFARGEVSLNILEHELNKLNNIGVANNDTNNGTFKERSRCGTPLSTLNAVPIPTSGGVGVPLPAQVTPAQKQNSVLSNENVCTNLSEQQPMSSILRSHHHEEATMHMPTQRELQMHTQAIMQNALYKKKLEVEQHEALRRRQEMQKQQELEASNFNQQQSLNNANSVISQQGHQQTQRHINSPTPLAFTPTSVLRKMTAEKDTISTTSQVSTMTSSSPQQIQSHFQQPHLKIPTHNQIHNQQMYQHSNQPRMILGGGNFQYMLQQQVTPAANGSPQVSPQQKSQIRNQPPGPLKWPLISHSSIETNHALLNNINNKPMGRPILKGPGPIQSMVPQNTPNSIGQNQSNVNQNTQSIQAVSQMQKYTPMPQPRQIVGQQFSNHIMQHQIPTSQQNMQQQLFQQQRPVVMQRQQMQQNDLGNHANLPPPAHHPACNDNNSVTNLNYQRDGGLSPTSNQLAQWFSPELLAQASAGKLPLLNMNQALSLEEFERSIQHSSTAVNN